MYHLMMGILLRKALFSDFIVVQTSQSAFTQTKVVEGTTHLSGVVEAMASRLQAACHCTEYCRQLYSGISVAIHREGTVKKWCTR